VADQGADGGAREADEESLREDYYLIPIDVFYLTERLESDLFFYYQGKYVLFKSRGLQWLQEDIEKLKTSAITELFAQFKSHKEHHDFLHKKLRSIVSNPTTPLEKKAKVLYETSDPILTTVYRTPNSGEIIQSASTFVRTCITYLTDRGSLTELFKLSGDSFSEYSHSLHVAAYSIALGKKVGIMEPTQQYPLGLGAMLHDIGKSKIDPATLNKPGPLTEDEWRQMRQHPEWGEQILYHRDIVPALSRRIVLEHHERVNGKGYPKQIKSAHYYSKIVAISDVFNSLTSNRPYAKAMKPYEALKYMIQNLKDDFDAELFEAFINMLSS